MIKRPPLRYVTPDTDDAPPSLYNLFIFFEAEKETNKDTDPPITHQLMFLSN